MAGNTLQSGLTTQQANEKLVEFGFNELPSSRPKNICAIAIEVMQEPMFLLLIGCSGLYMLLGDYHESLLLLPAVLVIIGITFYQYQKTEKALEALKQLASPKALVIRDGVERRIPGREIVPGDLVILNEGDRITADGIILNSKNLTVDESVLTGESMPIAKLAGDDVSGTSLIFGGTLVTAGRGLAEITATGIRTEFGRIGLSLKNIQPEETPLKKEMKKLIRLLFIIGIGLSILVIFAFYFTHGNFLQSLLNGLAAAMAILPEEFPVILTIFLALGAWRLSKVNVLTRKPSAIETLGSATVLCTDKTGTLTRNSMEVVAVYNGNTTIDRASFLTSRAEALHVLEAASIASHEDSFDPMDRAILAATQSVAPGSRGKPFIKEYPLSAELLAMTIVRKDEQGNLVAAAKGAPEAILELCRLPIAEQNRITAEIETQARNGYRILGVAHCFPRNGPLPQTQRDFTFHFAGLLALADPVRPEVPAAVAQCQTAGIRVIMITGDFPETARSIGKQIGLPSNGSIINGDELKKMSEAELSRAMSTVSILARVVPEQKLRIVRALKRNGAVVAMTGDGVNDAPALKAADIGIAMGMKGTDVAREAASLVLLDDNFASIVAAIRGGRRIFDNLRKAMSYVLAIHIPIIGLALIPALIPSMPILMMPIHIVFMELLIDPVCSIAFEYEQEEHDIMRRPPRDPHKKFFSGKRIIHSLLHGCLLLSMVLTVYFLSIKEGHSAEQVRAITFCSLILGNIALILSTLSGSRPFYASFIAPNYALVLILAIAILTLSLAITVPLLQSFFAFQFPGYLHFGSSLAGAGVLLLVMEAEKIWTAKERRKPIAGQVRCVQSTLC